MNELETAAAAAEIRVKFGTEPHQVMPVHWANLFLTILHRQYPVIFGQVLVQVVGAELPAARRRSRQENGQ